MFRALRRRGPAALGVGLAAVLVAATACGGDDGSASASGSGGGKVALTVNVFGNFGYEQLYKQFEAAHPNITITERGTGSDLSNYTPALTKNLVAGSGAGDVVALEEGIMIQFKEQAQNFVDLGQYGGNDDQSNFLPWKFAGGQSADGSKLIGLGTDVGSMGMCYRRDLFAKAGLPTSRAAVSKLWPTWQKFVAVGKRFQQHAPKGVSFVDSGSNVFNAIIGQLNPAYYDSHGQVIVGSNPKVKSAWKATMQAVQAHESAGLAAFSTDWNTGYKKGTFATVTCPAWMMGYIQGQAPKSKGKWDIASVPGGGGNWGGSFLTVPKQGSHTKEAYDLAKFLTSPASEAYIFKQTGNLPSQPALYKSKAITSFKNPFFNNAPVGKIFTDSAKKLKPQVTGPHQGDIQTAVSNAIQRVEQHKQSPDKSWKQFLKDVKAVA